MTSKQKQRSVRLVCKKFLKTITDNSSKHEHLKPLGYLSQGSFQIKTLFSQMELTRKLIATPTVKLSNFFKCLTKLTIDVASSNGRDMFFLKIKHTVNNGKFSAIYNAKNLLLVHDGCRLFQLILDILKRNKVIKTNIT